MRRTPGSRPLTGSTRRIDNLRPTTAGSRPFTPVGADRHPSHAPDAWIETPDRLHTADRHPSAYHCRIETLHAGQRGSTPFSCTERLDRDPRPAPHGGSTPFGSPLPDRDPSRRTARIDTLRARQSPGSRPSTGSISRIDTLRPTTAGSRPFTPDSADRHPSRAPDARIETLDRLHSPRRGVFVAEKWDISCLLTTPDGAESTPSPCAGRSGRAPARLRTRIEPFALEGPLDPDPRHRLRTLTFVNIRHRST